MHEYDNVELTSDHPELTPPLTSGARGVIVDLPSDSAVAAVEFDLGNDVEVFLLNLDELLLVAASSPHDGYDSSLD